MDGALLYLMRHGRAAPAGIMAGRSDWPLSPEGEAEAAGWRPFFRKNRVDAVWTSPLARARRTAGLVLGGTGPAPEVCAELMEISLGAWDGLETSLVRERFPYEWEERGRDPAGYAPPGGESYADLAGRILPFFSILRKKTLGLNAALIVAHRAVNQVILAEILGLPLEQAPLIPQDYASCAELELDPSGGVKVIRQIQAPPN